MSAVLNSWRKVGGAAYEISAAPVTNAEYCAFLNALPPDVAIAHSCNLMSAHFFGGIVLPLVSPQGMKHQPQAALFVPKTGFAKKPVVFVSWFDACAYADWTSTLSENAGYRCRLPTADEWRRAAALVDGRLTRYADGSDERPTQAVANSFDPEKGWALPVPHLADIDAFPATGPCQTFQMAGNVSEWVDTETPAGWKYALGGSLFRPVESLLTSASEADAPEKKLSTFGFRLVREKVAANFSNSHKGHKAQRGQLGDLCAFVRDDTGENSHEGHKGHEGENEAAEFVIIDHVRNRADNRFGGYGRVDYPFRMARCAVSNADYAEFLNAVATQADPFGLYHPCMASGILGGIGEKPSASYSPKPGWEKKPVVYVDWFSALRYCNWLHYGKPATGESVLGTTEGDAIQGAYDTRAFARLRGGDFTGWNRIGRRNRGARFWLPDNNEWYKAAYFDPSREGCRKYWNFPVRTSSLPDNREVAGIPSANYEKGETLGIGAPYYFADVDAYAHAASFFGTVQQGGNAWEWLEDWYPGMRRPCHCLRGGSFGYTETGLSAANIDAAEMNDRSYVFGFRVAAAVDDRGFVPVSRPVGERLRKLARSIRSAIRKGIAS